MASDDGAVLPPGEDRLDETVLPDAPGQSLYLHLGDPPGVRRVGSEQVDVYLDDF
jgi:hypothetical protein